MKHLLPVTLLALAGCAQLPHDLPPRPALKTPEAALTIATLGGTIDRLDPGAQTPQAIAHWWQAFGLPDLDRLIEQALRDQPDITAAQARLRAASQSERLERLNSDVHYETAISASRQHLSKNGLFPPPLGGSSFTQADITQNLTYALDWWGKNKALVSATRHSVEAARNEQAAAELAVAAAVADTYFAWAGVDAELTLARQMEALHRQELKIFEARFSLGLDSATPLADTRKKLDLDTDRIQSLEYLDNASRYRLGALIGGDPDHAAQLPWPILTARLPALPTTLPLDWLARRPDVAALQSRVVAAADLSDATRAEFYPNLDLSLMIGLDSLDLNKLLRAGSLNAAAGPALHLPFLQKHTLQAKLGLREADYAEAVATYNRTILDAARQAADAYALAASLEKRHQAEQKALAETQQINDLAEHRSQLGLSPPLDALETADAVVNERVNANKTEAARLRSRIALLQSLGGDATLKDTAP